MNGGQETSMERRVRNKVGVEGVMPPGVDRPSLDELLTIL
jgi:hypothetical protein